MKNVIFLTMPAAPGVPSFVFLPILCQVCQTVTTCAGYVDCYISTHASCDDLVPGMWIAIFLPMPAVTTCAGGLLYFYLCQLWRPVSVMQSVIFLPLPGCDDLCRYVDCNILSMPDCDDLCRVCGLLYFYLCQLWRPVPGMWSVIFLPMPAPPGGPNFVFLLMPTVPGFDELCQDCELL